MNIFIKTKCHARLVSNPNKQCSRKQNDHCNFCNIQTFGLCGSVTVGSQAHAIYSGPPVKIAMGTTKDILPVESTKPLKLLTLLFPSPITTTTFS